MKVLVYESGLGNNTVCIYETDATNIKQYAIEAYNGQHADDIIFDRDNYDDYDISLDENIVYADDEKQFRFDIAFDADELMETEDD